MTFRNKIYLGFSVFLLSLSMGPLKPAFANDITYILGGENTCRNKTNLHAIVVETYNSRKNKHFFVYEKKRRGWLTEPRIVTVKKDEITNRPIIYIHATSKYADTQYELKSDKPILKNASWERLVRFCDGLDY